MPTISSFRSTENKHGVYRSKDCMKNICEFLRKHRIKIFYFNKKINEFVNKRAARIILKCKNLLYLLEINIKRRRNVRDDWHYTGEYIVFALSISKLKFHAVFQNGSNCYYHFIMKKLAEKFKTKFTCLRENTEKDIKFTVPIETKDTRIEKNGEQIKEKYNLHFTVYR